MSASSSSIARRLGGAAWHLAAIAACCAPSARAAQTPSTVSPGELQRVVVVQGPCPTFNWTGVEGAGAYEIAVYDFAGETPGTRPVLHREIRGQATGWTPSLEHCLAPGKGYAWTVRADAEGAATPWSPPRLFRVAFETTPEELAEALTIVQRYLAEQERLPEGGSLRAHSALATDRGELRHRTETPSNSAPPRGAAASSFKVKGDIEAGSFTGDGSGLTSVDADTVDGFDLRAVGVLNLNDNPVDWTRLKSVPAGFADGVDADSGGTITSVGAGTGLTGGGNTGGVTIHADTSVLQKRVASTCPAGQSIRAITDKGGVICEVDDGTTYSGTAPVQVAGSVISLDGTVARKDSAAGDQAFDTDTLFLDYANDRVGIGLSNPDEELDVLGDVEATGQFRYSSSRSFHRFIAASGFEPDFNDRDALRLTGNTLFPNEAGNLRATAPVHLPAGADVSEVRCYYYDNSSDGGFDQIKFELHARPLGDHLPGTFLAAATVVPAVPVSPNVLPFADTTVSGAGDPINYASYAYSLAVQLNLTSGSTPGPDISFKGCRLTYTLDRVSH